LLLERAFEIAHRLAWRWRRPRDPRSCKWTGSPALARLGALGRRFRRFCSAMLFRFFPGVRGPAVARTWGCVICQESAAGG